MSYDLKPNEALELWRRVLVSSVSGARPGSLGAAARRWS